MLKRSSPGGVTLSWLDALLLATNTTANFIRIGSAAFGRGWEHVQIAKSLLSGQGFANPFLGGVTGPTAHEAPLYPSLLALEMRIVGYTPTLVLIAVVMEIVLQTAALLLLPRLAKRLFDTEAPGYVAAALMVMVNHPLPQLDVTLTSLLCTAGVLAAVAGAAGATSLLAGLAGLTNPAVCPALGWAALRSFSLRRAAWIAAGAVAICSPWMIRSRILVGVWAPVRDNFGMEIWISNADGAAPLLKDNGVLYRDHPMFSAASAERIKDVGEGEFNREALHRGIRWIQRNPERFARLTAMRIRQYWFPTDVVVICAMTILALPGLWLAPAAARRVFLPFIIVFPLPYYVVQAAPHYRYPTLWVSALLAAYTLTRVGFKMGGWISEFAAQSDGVPR